MGNNKKESIIAQQSRTWILESNSVGVSPNSIFSSYVTLSKFLNFLVTRL